MEDWMKERLSLARERVMGLAEELRDQRENPFQEFFSREAAFLEKVLVRLGENPEEGKVNLYEGLSLEECGELCASLFEDLTGEAYGHSFGNPAYARERLQDHGSAFTFLYAQLRGILPAAAQGKLWDVTILLELFLEAATLFLGEEIPSPEQYTSDLRSYCEDYCGEMVSHQVEETLTPEAGLVSEILAGDLSDLCYLYRYGLYVSETELMTARFILSLPQEEVDKMARVMVEGLRLGFVNGRKDIGKKSSVGVRYHLGFERVIKRAGEYFKELGLTPIYSLGSFHAPALGGFWVTSSPASRQYDYDHRQDGALYLTADFVQRKLRCLQEAYDERKEAAAAYAGPALLETFGENPFYPSPCPEALTYSSEQQKQRQKLVNEANLLVNRYIPQEERSFTIIAWPLPEIGENFEEIFRQVMKINTLDQEEYKLIQQKLIDTLDTSEWVVVKGKEGNDTDLIIHLHELKDPKGQTNFENCLADVNIPLGEVFTSPVLAGTGGELHVSQVYLKGLLFKDLHLIFDCGQVIDYSCANFETEEENRTYIEDNILFHHRKIPMGEFAIGTNTLAYALGRRFNIEDRLPILIAEKTGPHFALGDTCYAHEEDKKVYNPDGKEIIARENELSALRNEDIELAYYGCHTDVTLPYEELDSICVLDDEGEETYLIKDGRFVLPGTEKLNEALDALEKLG